MMTNYTRGNDSFDMEFMMPPDIMSIDSDISKYLYQIYHPLYLLLSLDKIGALTPSPFTDGLPFDNFSLTTGGAQQPGGGAGGGFNP